MKIKMAVISVLLLIASGALAMIEEMSLEKLAHGADAVLVGKVTGVQSTGKLPEGPEVFANLIEVIETLKGDEKVGDKVKIKTYGGITDNVVFKGGEKCLLFLRKVENHYEVFNGLQGCWIIDENGKTQGMGYGKSIDQVKAALQSVPLKLQPKFKPLSL